MHLNEELYGTGRLEGPATPRPVELQCQKHTVRDCLHLATLRNCHRKLGLVAWIGSHIFHLPHNQQALAQHAPKHNMLVVKPVCLGARNEELAAI